MKIDKNGYFERSEYRHERDIDLSEKLYENNVMKTAQSYLEKYKLEEVHYIIHTSSLLRISEKMSPIILHILRDVCSLVSLNEIPEIFLTRDYDISVEVYGYQHPYIVISSDYLDRMDESMLFGVLAGQIAGIKAGHHKTLFLLWAIEYLSKFVPGLGMVTEIIANQWKRSRYFTYDRAFYLATEDYKLTLQSLLINHLSADEMKRMHTGSVMDLYKQQVEDFIESHGVGRTYHEIFSEQEWLPERYAEIEKYHLRRNFNAVKGGGQ